MFHKSGIALIYLGITFLFTCFLFSCKKPGITDYVSFNIQVVGRAPDALVGVNNTSLTGKYYSWTFSADSVKYFASAIKCPYIVLIKKPCYLTVSLVDSIGKSVQMISQSVRIIGYDSLLRIHSQTLSLHYGNSVYGRLFSTYTGLAYKDNQMNASTAPVIDIIFCSHINSVTGDTLYSMISPRDTINPKFNPDSTAYNDSVTYNRLSFTAIDSVVNSKYYEHNETTSFDTMTNDRFFYRTALLFVYKGKMNSQTLLNSLILFKNAFGKMGLIRPTYIDGNKITFDVVMQKY